MFFLAVASAVGFGCYFFSLMDNGGEGGGVREEEEEEEGELVEFGGVGKKGPS